MRILALKHAFIVTAGVAALVGLYILSTWDDHERDDGIHNHLNTLHHLNTVLDQDLLKARTLMALDYDCLVHSARRMEASFRALAVGPYAIYGAGDSEIDGLYLESMHLYTAKAELIEDFKSHDAVLKNSTRYLPLAGAMLLEMHSGPGAPDLWRADVENLLRQILIHELTGAAEERIRLEEQIERLRERSRGLPEPIREGIAGVLLHVQSIQTNGDEVDGLLRQIEAISMPAALAKLTAAYDARTHDEIARIGFYRLLFILTGVTLLAYGTLLTMQIRRRAIDRVLEARRERERIFTLSVDMFGISGADGYFKQLNPAWEHTLGFDTDELRSRPWLEFVHAADRTALAEEVERLVTVGGGVTSGEYRFRHQAGHHRWLLWLAEYFPEEKLLYSVAHDITERKKAEEALRESEERYRELFEGANDLILILNPSGEILFANQSFQRALGYSARETLGLSLPDILHPGSLEESLAAFSSAISGEGGANLESVFVTRDGQTITVEGQVSCQFVDGSIVASCGIFRDITRRKELERMKDEFVATVSHELRTPLSSIQGSLGLLTGLLADKLSADARSMLDIAFRNSERLKYLVDDILDIERLEIGKMPFHNRPVEIMSVIRTAIESQFVFADLRGVVYVVTEALEGAMVNADPERLNQVMTNLLTNAAKFSPRGGEVAVAVRRQRNLLRIVVEDRGPGIPEKFRTRIFRRFAQADSSATRQEGGTGLGLSIVKSIVERLGGTVSYESPTGQGTRFFVELPEFQQPRDRPGDPRTQADRILVCEDDADVAHLLTVMLEMRGFATGIAMTPGDVRAALAAGGYTAMTLEIALGDMAGLTLLEELQASEHRIPIIVITGRTEVEPADVDTALLGIVDWLPKPIDEDRLLGALRYATSPRVP